MLDLSDTGVPVGTTEQIRYGQNLIKCRSTRRYYRTDQIQDLSDTGLSGSGVPVGTTEQIRYMTKLIRYRTDRIQEYP